jgi:c(7)-type cytochrome triheme protein
MRVQLMLMALLAGVHGNVSADWKSLAEDGIHDPAGPAIEFLQEPREILSLLPNLDAGGAGNQVRWARAIESGAISPRRSRLLPEIPVEVPVLDMDVLLNLRGSMRIVRFPHKVHTMWLACNNCHDEIFKPKIGANNIAMYNILNGEQCGRCHGAVSFPVTECRFCHSVRHPGDTER